VAQVGIPIPLVNGPQACKGKEKEGKITMKSPKKKEKNKLPTVADGDARLEIEGVEVFVCSGRQCGGLC
jgi:hypothetical protein